MKFITNKKNNNNQNFYSIINKIAYIQLIMLGLIGILFYIYEKSPIANGFFIIGIACFSYTQLIKISRFNTILALFGFPLRLILVGFPCAILIHKFNCNLLALFIGFVLCQIIYISYIWQYALKGINNNLEE